MRTVFLPSKFEVVEGYFSHLSPAQKQMYAMQAIEHVANRANSLTPIAASVTGSSLRGNDRLDSDVEHTGYCVRKSPLQGVFFPK